MKTITISVTQDDIDKGERCLCYACPIALAAQRIVKGHVSIGSSFLILPFIFPFNIIHLPPKAKKFISNFDNKLKVKPFKFNIQIPDDITTN